jgi:hypothetical protein
MVKDAHDDPYSAQHRKFVLACAECGSVERIYGLRKGEGFTHETPFEPLCRDCTDIHLRVWGQENLSQMGPPDKDTLRAGDDVLYVVLCTRCNGTGMTPWGLCNQCIGLRHTVVDPKGVRRTARWWQTYQQNRTKPPD